MNRFKYVFSCSFFLNLLKAKQSSVALHFSGVEVFTYSTASIFVASVARNPQSSAQSPLDPYVDPLSQMFGPSDAYGVACG